MMGKETIGEDKALTWEQFEEKAKADIEEVKSKRAKAKNKAVHSAWIYRGHSCACWQLETSLERFLRDELGQEKDTYPAKLYYVYLSSIVPVINSLTDQKFEKFKPQEVHLMRSGPMPHCELLYFARHHGFPTPILDWTASYYVAAFFAFRHSKRGEDVAIYAYKEWNERARGGRVDNPIINQQGSYVETHARHYKQQSIYTICSAKIDDKIFFMKHEVAVEQSPENHSIKKFILRAGEKEKVLENLFSMNINDYTLFGDDESLMRMLAYKEFRDI